jgi:chromosome segregation ATPase
MVFFIVESDINNKRTLVAVTSDVEAAKKALVEQATKWAVEKNGADYVDSLALDKLPAKAGAYLRVDKTSEGRKILVVQQDEVVNKGWVYNTKEFVEKAIGFFHIFESELDSVVTKEYHDGRLEHERNYVMKSCDEIINNYKESLRQCNDNFNETKQELRKVKRDLDDHVALSNVLQTKVATLEAEVRHRENALAREMEQNVQQNEKILSELEETHEKLEAARRSLKTNEDEIVELRKNLERADAATLRAESLAESYRKAYDSAREMADMASQETDTVRADLDTVIIERDTLANRVGTLDAENDRFYAERNEANERCDTLNDKVKRLNADVELITAEHDKVLASMKQTQLENAQLHSVVNSLSAERDSILVDLYNTRSSAQTLQTMYEQQQSDVSSLWNECNGLMQQNQELVDERAALLDQVKEVKTDRDNALIALAQYESELKEAKQAANTAQLQTADTRVEVINLNAKIVGMVRDQSVLKSELDTAQKTIAELKKRLENYAENERAPARKVSAPVPIPSSPTTVKKTTYDDVVNELKSKLETRNKRKAQVDTEATIKSLDELLAELNTDMNRIVEERPVYIPEENKPRVMLFREQVTPIPPPPPPPQAPTRPHNFVVGVKTVFREIFAQPTILEPKITPLPWWCAGEDTRPLLRHPRCSRFPTLAPSGDSTDDSDDGWESS